MLADPLDLLRHRPWVTPSQRSPQGEFFAAGAAHRERLFQSGNQVGKTHAGAWDVCAMAMGLHPFITPQRPPPVEIWVSALSWDVCALVLWPKLKPLLPRSARVTFRRRAAPEIPSQIAFSNGSIISFRSAEQGREKYQGGTIDAAWVDEEHPPDIIEEIKARLIHRQGWLTATLTPLRRERWVQELRDGGAHVTRASMIEAAEAGLMDLERVLAFSRSLPERQRRVRIFGELVALEGLVYPTLSRLTHSARPHRGELVMNGRAIAPWPLPASWRRYASVDWGYANPTAVILACEDPHQGRLIIERCYHARGIRGSRWGELLATRLPKLTRPLISDHDAQARAEVEAEGINTTPAMKDIDAGIEAVERFVDERLDPDGEPKLVIVLDEEMTDGELGRCDGEVLFSEAETYQYPERKAKGPDVKEAPIKRDDHAMDALRYLVYGYESSRGGAPKPPPYTPQPDRAPRDHAAIWMPDPGSLM